MKRLTLAQAELTRPQALNQVMGREWACCSSLTVAITLGYSAQGRGMPS